MSQSDQNPNSTGENQSEEQPRRTPLDQVQEQQAIAQQNLEVTQQREEPSPEVPGHSNPSNRRKHPERQMYGQGTNES